MPNQNPRALGVSKASLSACIAALLSCGAPALTHASEVMHSPLLTLLTAKPKSRSIAAPASAAPSVIAGDTIAVTSCDDDGGFDTLRHAVLIANPGDTIDLRGLACSTLTLQAGAIAIGLNDLTILGPGASKLAIDGNQAGRVFNHTNDGKLTLSNLTIAHGKVEGDKAYGGCIFSKGDVTLDHSVVTSCSAIGQSVSLGGGIVTYGILAVRSSVISANTASTLVGATDRPPAAGGGAFAQAGAEVIESIVSGNVAQAPSGKVYGGGFITGTLVLKYSTISNNTAASAGTVTEYGSGGGFVTLSDTTIFASTIDHNLADAAGGVSIRGGGETQATIALTTISSNVGTLGIGALDTMADLTLRGSTIAFNSSGPTVPSGVTLSGGTTDLQSTIIADNAPMDLAGGGAIFGNNSLVKIAAPGTLVPVGTLTLDPKLGPLAFNGGPTRTHALGAGSPALEAGSNGLGYAFDQRGPTYLRDIGNAPDIGAYESDNDHIFGDAIDHPYAL